MVAEEFSISVRVYIEDTDAGGIVYYVNYLKFMERCRTEFLRTLGYHKPAILDDGLLLVVHAAQVDYRRPARLDDELLITSSITKLARTYIEFKQQVFREQELLSSGLVRVACVDAALMKPRPIPADMHQQLSQLQISQI
ncbi:tol-pal system-associated acyl-CoA thioesterase [Cellvibrio zantedeschiae]|uniref:Tol-pal system-associated acyl-CoA thioesterase n=1 Tax=Cellvibrio zantedeschiae TaxID=1237077 RepID=A0ABQ3AVL5_9GAMM|nr:tol-pal system-associated acyl-CoA thioesterase [Cellvibrio zantedeschiae]GGY65925.1 tol-pal system-associated acyl-CoA thioesterase [Cellvibrio zantedeschiae]